MNTVVQVKDKEFALYISEEKIKARVQEVATQIDEDLRKKNPLFLVILNGSFVFAADLLRCCPLYLWDTGSPQDPDIPPLPSEACPAVPAG